jgi:drug/metabolite transporter (DMT)-like permease
VNGLLLALGASLAWGVADFVGPWQGRALGALRVMFWAQIAGMLAIGLAVAVRGDGPAGWQVLYAIPAALSGTLGLIAYYRGMAIGAMAVVAPIAGASAIVPVIFGIARGDRPHEAQYVGIGCALVGVVLASQEHQERAERKIAAGVGLALLAALGFGFYFPAMHAAGEVDAWWSSLVFRVTATAIIAVAVAGKRPALRLSRWKLAIVLGVGLGDTLGNALFAAASHAGGLISLTSVLASLYPIVTVLLAAVVLNERIAPLQRLGVVLTLGGVILISA